MAIDEHLLVLLDLQSAKEASVVAVFNGGQWQAPSLAGESTLKRLAKKGAVYQILSSASGRAAGAGKGALSGKLRTECAEFYFGLAKRSKLQGFALVSSEFSNNPIRPVPLLGTSVEPSYVAAVARVFARATNQKISPTVEHAYRIDLDGNGKPEVVLQATHPDLNDDPADYKPQYYSLIVVLPDTAGGEPAFVGYMQGAKGMSEFEVLTLDSVADLNLDGKRELLVRARHNEGWQTKIFSYDGKLKEVFRSVDGEGQCPGSSE